LPDQALYEVCAPGFGDVGSGLRRAHRKSVARYESARFPNLYLSNLLRLMTTYNVSSLEELLGTTPSARLAAAWEEEGWDAVQEESS
jgi:hypothetical protein